MAVINSYNGDNNHDFEFAQWGLQMPAQSSVIYNDSGDKVVWDFRAYDFLQTESPPTANASLWRQGQLCNVTAGLYQVVSGVYQIRGFDLANMSIVQIPGTNEIVVIDCLTSVETARAALDLYQTFHQQTYGRAAGVRALFYTHCHVDHFGGAQAIVDAAGDNLLIFGPDGFLEHAVSENVYAGSAMARRSIYMYGQSLNQSPMGQIGCGLGQALSTGTSSLVAPTHNIAEDGPLKRPIEGLDIICQLTPGTEAPAEVNFFFPGYSALCMAENATHTLHNIQTLRGAPVRDARLWSRYMDESLTLFGDRTDVVFSSHHWPTWKEGDRNLVVTFLSEQRDYYAYLHNETLRLLNDGATPVEIAETIQTPEALNARTNLRGYYGSVSHNVKAIYDKYMGWFDGNPANLWRLPPTSEAIEFVRCMGGSELVLQKASEYQAKGELRFAATLLDKAVFADPDNQAARKQLASVYTDLGQGAENGPWRNYYLVGAQELQNPPQPAINSMTDASMMALALDELFDTIAIRIDGPQASRHEGVTIDFMVQDFRKKSGTNAGWRLRLSHGALTGRAVPYRSPTHSGDSAVNLTVWLSHQDLVGIIGTAAAGSQTSLDQLTTSGDVSAWSTVTSYITVPNSAFNIVTP